VCALSLSYTPDLPTPFYNSHPKDANWYPIVGLSYFSLMNSGSEHLFMCLLSHLYSFFGEMSVQVLCSLLNWVVWFLLLLSCMGFFLCSGCQAAIRQIIWIYILSHPMICFFTPVFFDAQEF
jgi:hypothetical protein